MKFPVKLAKEPEGGYTVTFPDIPEAISCGTSVEDALYHAKDALESAIAQPMNVWYYGNGDLYEIAAAYAYHIAESQAYFDGNKRTPVQAALDFLEVNGIDTDALPEMATYQAMIRVANHELDRAGLAEFLRETLRSE